MPSPKPLHLGFVLFAVTCAAPACAEETPTQKLFAECFVTKQKIEDDYMNGIRELIAEYGQKQDLETAAKLYRHVGQFPFTKKWPMPDYGVDEKHRKLIEMIHAEANKANGVLRRGIEAYAESESKAGNVSAALAAKRKLDEYFSGKLIMNAAQFPDRYGLRIVKVGHPYPKLVALNDRTLPNEMTHAHRNRVSRIYGGCKVDTVKVGRLKIGHIGKAVMFTGARGRKGWLRIHQPQKTDATGYFALLATKTTSFNTVSLARLKVNTPYEWEIDYIDGEYQFIVLENGEPVIERSFKTVRKLDIGFAATVRRPGNLADIIVFTDHVPPKQ